MNINKIENNFSTNCFAATETVVISENSTAQLYTSEFVEINLITSGGGVHRVSDRSIPCREGDVCVISHHTSHEYSSEEKGDLCVFRILFNPKTFFLGDHSDFKNPQFCFGVFCEGETVSYATLNKKSRAEIETFFSGVARETELKYTNWKNAVGAYLSVILITISRYMNGAIRDISSLSGHEREVVSFALRIMNEEFKSPDLTLESVAKSLFVSPSQLSRSFKQGLKKTFSDFLRELRLEEACRLLKDTELNNAQILEECGLRDLPSFYRNFQSYTNMTPSQYRSLYNNQVSKTKGAKIMVILSEISENLQKGKSKLVKEMVQQAIDEGCEPEKILNEGLLDGMNIIGEKFKNNEIFVPEVLVAARAMNMGLSVVKPLLISGGIEAVGKVCIGTVQGDLHDIGKNLVKMMMEGKGLEVIDLGVDVPPEVFVNTAKEEGCRVICCSALLTTTMDVMAEIVKAAEAAGIRDKVKIMVGGAPLNQEYCDEIGADCYTVDAASAADAAVAFCKK